jgi:hypothetical protein
LKSPLVFRIFKKDQIFVVKQFIDNDRIIFGNGAEVNVELEAPEISPIHCLVEKRGGEYYLCDLGSAQGTFKNNEQVLDEPISSGDNFQIGPFNIFFFVGAQKSIVTPPPEAKPPQIKQEKPFIKPVVVVNTGPAVSTGQYAKKSKKTFAPKSDVSDLKDQYKVGSGQQVEVIVTWQERVINTYHFAAKGTKFLGAGADIDVPEGSAPKGFNLLDLKSGVVINTTSEMHAEVVREGEVTELAQGAYVLNQAEVVFVKLINGMQLVIRFSAQAPPVVFDSPIILGSSELTGLLAALIIAVVASLIVSVSKPKQTDTEEEIERIAQVVFTRPPNHATALENQQLTEKAVAETKKREEEQKQKEEEIKKALLLNENKQSQVFGDPLHPNQKSQSESQQNTGKPSDVKPKDPSLKAKMFTSTKNGGAVKTGAVSGANAKSKDPDPNNSGLLAAFGEGGARNKLDKVYNGSGELIGAGEKAKGVSGFDSNRNGDDLGSKIKDTGAGGSGTATQGIAGVGTKGRSNGNTGYGSGTGLGDKDRVQISAGGTEEAFAGSIDKEAVRRVVRSALSQFKACYEREYRQNTRLEGKVVITWEIHEQGVAKNAFVVKDKSTINNSSVEECVKSRMLGLKFPEPPAGTAAVVTYPFIFKGQKL